ncbi:hypothetical protein M8C21_022362, partial [Ambrosia artemisiifolia]
VEGQFIERKYILGFWQEFSIAHGNRDSWNSMIHGMPIPHENGIGHGEEKHINERANPVPVEMQETGLETENWHDLLGMYTDLLQEKTPDTNGIIEENNRQLPPVVNNNGNQNWVASNRNLTQTSNHVVNQNHTSNQATIYNASLTSMLGSQQTQRFTSNNVISNVHSPNDGFPVNYNARYSPGSPPRFKPDAAASRVTDSSTFAPITPDNQKKHMDGQRVQEKVTFLDEETSTHAENRHGNQTVSMKDAENLYNELLQTIENSPPSAVSTTQKDCINSEDKDEQGTDLHKTPNQKTPPRRKKHRPKVIREGKPKRTPKGPKIGSSGEIRVKRKYVRRKVVNNSNENTPVESVQKRKYVRKKGVNGSNEKNPAETVQKRKYVRKKGVDNLEQQQQSTANDTTPKSCKKQLNFDSESVTQDEGHDNKSSQQDINVPSTPLVKARYHGLNVIARNMASSPKQDRWENGYVNKVNELVHGNGIKNGVFQADMRPTNPQCTHQSFTSECMVSFDEKRGIKRQSCEQMSHNENAMNSLLLYQRMLLGVANRGYNCNQLSSTLLENHKKMKMQSEFQDNSRQMKGILVNGSSMGLLNSCTVKIDPSYKIINVGGTGYNPHFRRPMAATHYLLKRQLLNGMRPHMMRSMPERLQRYTQGAMISWSPNRASRYAVTTYPKVEPNLYNQRLNGLNEKLQQHRNNSLKSYQQSIRVARGRPRKQKAEDPVDDITHKLERLHIYDGNKNHQNELVLYKGGEAIIPFEPIRKRNQRPKVDLDPETERLWNLLMGNEGSEGAEKLDNEKEKWWENERRVFRGRTDSFIARMHLVQGDRRFSRWKGSVVDSVIGVFLTQNVSDHLSSSAFMALAAKFPPKSTTADKTCCQDDITKCHEKITTCSNLSDNMTHQISSTTGAENKHSSISVEEVILSQDSSDSSTIQTVNEYGSSSGSNSEADDVTTGIETSNDDLATKMHHPPEDNSCNDDLTTTMHHPPKEPASNIPISQINGIELNSSSSTFQMGTTPGLPSSNSGVTEACHTSNVTCPQNEIPKFQIPSQGQYNLPSSHPSQILSTNQHAKRLFKETTHDAPKEVSNMFGRIPIISDEDRTSAVSKQNCFENTVFESNSREQNASQAPLSGSGPNMPKAKKETPADEKNRTIDWDSLRKEALSNGEKKERSNDAKDTIDYEALRHANINEISDAIKERGMNNLLADRMQDFLNRLVRDHGSVDLEWLRDAPPDKAKDYLLSFRGLGLKSVECVRLLTLHHLAFPVDTNVGRIAVRLGWVPLQPLPESLQLHLLEMYPVLESIQKYLWPRLCKLDQLTLYELHYQMITFGKVFCTKSKPNCNACPMRAECRHFASAFARYGSIS